MLLKEIAFGNKAVLSKLYLTFCLLSCKFVIRCKKEFYIYLSTFIKKMLHDKYLYKFTRISKRRYYNVWKTYQPTQ